MARLYWLTGYSGAGKTVVGRELYRLIKQNRDTVVLLDGDEMRAMFGNDLGYCREDRLKSAMRFARLSEFLTSQGIDVVCCTVSMFNEVREWNRANIEDYVEVYIKVSRDVLRLRDQKGLYSGDAGNVVGVDLILEEPQSPDIVIENDGSVSAEQAAQMIYKGESYYVR
jgi:adenylylsulfate kinase